MMDVIRYCRIDGRDTVKVFGELDAVATPPLAAALSTQLIAVDAHVDVDLTECAFIFSSAISVLIKAYRERSGNLRVRVAGGSQVHRIFQIVGLDKLFVQSDFDGYGAAR